MKVKNAEVCFPINKHKKKKTSLQSLTTLPFTLQFASESPMHENDSDMHNLSLNLDVMMLRIFFFATATNFPFTLHSTMKNQKPKQTGN